MYKICQTERSTNRQRELEQGLLRMMQKRRYEDISVSDLCEHLQIPRRAFYRYFSDKEGALYSLIDHTLADFFEIPLSDKKSRGTAIGDLDLFFLFWYERKDLLDALEHSRLSGILVERANNFALREGYMPRQLQGVSSQVQSMAMAFSLCGLMSMILRWHHEGFVLSPSEMTTIAVNLLTSPLINNH